MAKKPPQQHWAVSEDSEDQADGKPQIWEDLGHKFEAGELESLKRSIAEMALSRIDGMEELYVGG